MEQDDHIESSMHENRTFVPPEEFVAQATISSVEKYKALYQASLTDPEGFWKRMALENLSWFKAPSQVLDYHWEDIGSVPGSYVKWFEDGSLNISVNCIDRHVASGRGDKLALIWQGEAEEDKKTLTYKALLDQVQRFANVLKQQGVEKGTVVTIYMPMIPEAVIAMQACARIGAIHSVVFSAFSSDALASRIQDCDSSVIITTDSAVHAGKPNPLKEKADVAAESCPTVERMVVFQHTGVGVPMKEGRDVWWHEALETVSPDCPPAQQASEDPLFILYTSGSTGKPKGVMHTTAGYNLYTHLTCKYVFDIKEEDIFWCTADVGWITGHSYLTYGPLSMGATCMMFEGVPTYPEPDRFWKIVEAYKVTIFYTAPTAIRALMRLGESWPDKHDLSSLRLLGTVGEPINPEAWMWYHEVIGQKQCPIIDTWWQTETGGHMLLTLPGAHATKPGSAGFPFFGVKPEIWRLDRSPCDIDEGGSLVITKPWPGMMRGVYGDECNALVKKNYFEKFPGVYFSGDGCRVDGDGYYWLMGRMDDVINVSGHRFATAEFESALVGDHHVAEAAVVGYPHDIKGQGVYCFVTLKQGVEASDDLKQALRNKVREDIGPIASPDKIHFTSSLPKTRSGKIMRRILRKIAEGNIDQLGDTSTLADPSVLEELLAGRPQ